MPPPPSVYDSRCEVGHLLLDQVTFLRQVIESVAEVFERAADDAADYAGARVESFDLVRAALEDFVAPITDAAERLAWKPHQKSMSLGGLATHISNLPVWGGSILSASFFDLGTLPPNAQEKTSRRDILAAFDENTKQTRAAMDRTDAEYLDRWTLKRGDQEMFSMPKVAAFRTFLMYHLVHHRGQLSVYLRLNEIPVPAIYGPTADEG